ncbi:MAG: hypothetical protein H6R05_1671 [Burkholderiaceae bacterium]|nr:hypothetical protein [Burkholderiaceae bacterium]
MDGWLGRTIDGAVAHCARWLDGFGVSTGLGTVGAVAQASMRHAEDFDLDELGALAWCG